MNEAWVQGQRDAVERIELYEKCVTRCVAEMERALGYKRTEIALWVEIKRLYEILVARRPDGGLTVAASPGVFGPLQALLEEHGAWHD